MRDDRSWSFHSSPSLPGPSSSPAPSYRPHRVAGDRFKSPLRAFDLDGASGAPPPLCAARPRACTMGRVPVVSDEQWAKRVRLERVANHFLFTVESTGVVPPERILRDAISVLHDKAAKFVQELDAAERVAGGGGGDDGDDDEDDGLLADGGGGSAGGMDLE